MQKSTVMTLANVLHYQKGLNRSQALKTAWKMVKQAEFNSKAVGVSFGQRQKALARLKQYRPESVSITLEREANAFDRNAVAVKVAVNGSKAFAVGYLSREAALLWAKLVEKNKAAAKQVHVTGGNGRNYGINFKLCLVA